MDLKYVTKPFDMLTSDELYRILQLRQEVFIVEQDCPYLDADGKDASCLHVLGITDSNHIESYCRICPPGVSYEDYTSIGRVLTAKNFRRSGEGRRLMKFSIEQTKKHYPNHRIKISAQTYLLKFYTSLGFTEVGERYLEDGIPHMAMVK